MFVNLPDCPDISDSSCTGQGRLGGQCYKKKKYTGHLKELIVFVLYVAQLLFAEHMYCMCVGEHIDSRVMINSGCTH